MNNIKFFRQQKGFSQAQLATKIGVSRSTVAMWETNKSQPDNQMLVTLSKLLETSVDCILGQDTFFDSSAPLSSKGKWIPVLGNVQAGIPIEAIEDIIDYEEISLEMANTGDFFALKIRGESMEPKMSNNDVVIVKKQCDCDNNDTAVVLVNGDSATVKKIKKLPNGIMLVSTNPSFEPMFYSNEDIEKLPVQIIGKVVELRAKF